MTKNFAVIGYPLNYSLSPLIHNFWFKKYNIDANYSKITLNPDINANILLKQVQEMDLTGFNITVPFKEQFFKMIDSSDEISSKIHAINTVKIQENKLLGYNTDYYGFMETLNQINFKLNHKNILVIGAGGAARAIIKCLVDNKVNELYVANRTSQKIENLKLISANIKQYNSAVNLDMFDIIINTTSCNKLIDYPIQIDFEQIHKDCLIYDVNYHLTDTEIILNSKFHNLNFIEGYSLLLAQAQYAFNIWFGFMPQISTSLLNLVKKQNM